MNIQYIGEHLFAGYLGKAFIWLSILTLILSAIYFVKAAGNTKNTKFAKRGSQFFIAHFATLLGAIATLYYLIITHSFEYSYVWQYSSFDMPWKFLISCFWAGQEGSYLIWALFQGIIGLVLLKSAGDWKPQVVAVFSTGQFFLLSMVLGLSFGDFSIGGSPFTLLRNMPQNLGQDLFNQPNYLSMIADGNGLNPLLENIWMIIHPPSLFLGYAVALVPFSYAVASLWRKDYHSWLKEGIIWTLAGILSLGIGIILGGRWAYESLTFGGFWAWDPVENASLVPWLLLIATLHTMLIARKRFHTYATTYLFTILSWFFVVYATYLTRSGVLGETSVHSFGENALSGQMIVFCLLFLFLPLILLLIRKKELPVNASDEVLSREFWMLIGSVIAVLSAFQVIVTTSIPVLNKILGTNVAPPIDSINFYNTWQLPFAVVITLLISISQYLWYGKNDVKIFAKRISIAIVISFISTILIALTDHIEGTSRLVLLFSVLLSLVVSVDFIIRYVRKTSNIGAASTHAGFALFVLGVILAFGNSQIISKNTSGFDLGKESDNAENLVLMKGISQPMGKYLVTYKDEKVKGRETFFQVDFVNVKDTANGKVAFTLYPSLNENTRMGNVYNPDTRHFIDKDIYTFISFSQKSNGEADNDGYSKKLEQPMDLKDTLVIGQNFLILDNIETLMKNDDVNNAKIIAQFQIVSMQKGNLNTEASFEVKDGELLRNDGIVNELNLKLRFENVSAEPNSKAIIIGVYEKQQDFIVLKAIVFPFIPVLWIGIVLMFSGLSFSIIRRRSKAIQAKEAIEDKK